MATAKLVAYPKLLGTKVADFAKKIMVTEETLLSAIVLFSLDNQVKFDSQAGMATIDINKDIQNNGLVFSIGPLTEKDKIKKWGLKSGRKEYELQILFIVTRFFELEYKTLPKKYLEKAALIK